jgi:hypothetical protein
MRRYRHDLLSLARGRTVEMGSGTGLNLVHNLDAGAEQPPTTPAARL